MFYLICYDIVEDRCRNRVANLLKGYGLRVQKSVFECVLSPEQYELIRRRLLDYIEPTEDQVRFYPLSSHCRERTHILGIEQNHTVDAATYII